MLTHEEGVMLLDLIQAGTRMSNCIYNMSHEVNPEARGSFRECRPDWDDKRRDASVIFEKLRQLPAEFDPIAMGM